MFTRQDVCQQSIAKMHLYKTKKNAFIVSTWNKLKNICKDYKQ